MSRSIHKTRRHLEEELLRSYGDPCLGKRRSEDIEEQLATKRRIKRQVLAERGDFRPPVTGAVGPDAININVPDSGEYVFYPVTIADIREVLAALPPGSLDRIGSIHLVREIAWSDRDDAWGGEDEVDPYIGRPGQLLFDDIWSGRVLGDYSVVNRAIRLSAMVSGSSQPMSSIGSMYLKLHTLSVLAHEVAHHQDFTTRIARGRWRGDDKEQAEIYAEHLGHEWTKEAVVPYLQRVYPKEVEQLQNWLLQYSGAEVPFDMLVPDPPETVKGGYTRLVFKPSDAFCEFINDVTQGKDLTEARVGFAEYLHFGDFYEKALEILDSVLSLKPDNNDALALKADICEHMGDLENAEGLARSVIARNGDHVKAWRVLIHVWFQQKQWLQVLEAANHLCRLDETAWQTGFVLRRAARALIELERYHELDAVVVKLAACRGPGPVHAAAMKAVALLRRGLWKLAYEEACSGLDTASDSFWRHELLAVKADAAHRLGLPDEDASLNAETLDRLRDLGYEAWADSLAARASGSKR